MYVGSRYVERLGVRDIRNKLKQEQFAGHNERFSNPNYSSLGYKSVIIH